MNNLSAERTPSNIAAEILIIRQQSNKILLTNAVEIGRRLKEAKELLPHGQWGKWLDKSVSYSQSTANKLMHVYEEYGTKLLVSFNEDDRSNSESIPNLTYSQALILLGIPEEEREQFISENNVETMSNRDLRQSIAKKNRALEEKDQTIQENEASDYKHKYEAEQEKVTQKQKELAEAKQEIPPDRKVSEMQEELRAVKAKTSGLTADIQFTIHRDNMINAYDGLLSMLNTLAETDPKLKEEYREKAYGILENLTKRLKVYPPGITTNLKIKKTVTTL